jgi:hypothetical protein
MKKEDDNDDLGETDMTVEEQMFFKQGMSEQIQEDIISWFASELSNKRIFISDLDGDDVEEIQQQEMIDELCNVVVLRARSTPISESHPSEERVEDIVNAIKGTI